MGRASGLPEREAADLIERASAVIAEGCHLTAQRHEAHVARELLVEDYTRLSREFLLCIRACQMAATAARELSATPDTAPPPR